MNSKNRITYRFDRTGNTVGENIREAEKQQAAPQSILSPQATDTSTNNKPARTNVVPLHNHNDPYAISEFSPWNSPFQEDISALEQLIRNTDDKPNKPAPVPSSAPAPRAARAAAPAPKVTERKREQSLPAEAQREEELEAEGVIISPELDSLDGQWSMPIRRYTTPPSWMKVFLSVAGALATGAVFGYLLLSLFTGTSIWPKDNALPVNTVPQGTINDSGKEPAGGNVGGGDAPVVGEGGQPASVPMVALSVQAQSYYLLQYGVFSNAEGMNAAIAELTSKGLAAAGLTTASDYRVFAGMAGDRSQAAAISKQLTDMEVYVKQIDIAVPEQFPFNGKAAAAESFFTQTNALIGMLDDLALTQLEQPSLSPLGSSAAEAWQTEHQEWTESVKAMQAGVEDQAGKAFLIKLIQSINTAAESMAEYDKNPSQSHLWAVQSALMDSISTQKGWFESISAL